MGRIRVLVDWKLAERLKALKDAGWEFVMGDRAKDHRWICPATRKLYPTEMAYSIQKLRNRNAEVRENAISS